MLRRLHQPAVDLNNRLCRRRSWEVDWFGVPAKVDVVGVQRIGDTAAQPSHELLARLHWRGMTSYLGLSHVAAEAALSGHLGAVLWRELPPAVAIALLQDGADRLAAANPGLGILRFEAMADAGALSHSLCSVQWRVTTEGRGEVIDLHWMVDADAIDQGLFSGPHRGISRCADLLPDWSGLPIPLAVELGWVHLSLSELQGLRNEDVLLPDGWWAQHGKGRVGLRVGARASWDRGYVGVLDETRQRIKVTGQQKMERDLPEDMLSALGSSTHLPGADGPDDLVWDRASSTGTVAGDMGALGDLPVRLTFDLGERHLALHELASLGAGHVFDLGLSPRHGVSLRVNGLLVGEGEIVEIDGRLGVAVTRILPPRA
jgi:type III secretion protein Q